MNEKSIKLVDGCWKCIQVLACLFIICSFVAHAYATMLPAPRPKSTIPQEVITKPDELARFLGGLKDQVDAQGDRLSRQAHEVAQMRAGK